MELSCSLDCQVVNSVQYVTRVREVDSTVKLLCQHCLSSVVGMAEQEDLERRKESLESSLLVCIHSGIHPETAICSATRKLAVAGNVPSLKARALFADETQRQHRSVGPRSHQGYHVGIPREGSFGWKYDILRILVFLSNGSFVTK